MFICRLSTTVEVFQSKEKPKKLVFRNELGEEFLFLCKQERKGDLRKDLRVMENVSIVNQLLADDSEGRERRLQLTTLVTLPFSSYAVCNHSQREERPHRVGPQQRAGAQEAQLPPQTARDAILQQDVS